MAAAEDPLIVRETHMRMNAIIVGAALLLATEPVFAADFTLASPEIANGTQLPAKQVFNGFGCTGENRLARADLERGAGGY